MNSEHQFSKFKNKFRRPSADSNSSHRRSSSSGSTKSFHSAKSTQSSDSKNSKKKSDLPPIPSKAPHNPSSLFSRSKSESAASSPSPRSSKKFSSHSFHEELLKNDCHCDGTKHKKSALNHKPSKAKLSHPYNHKNDATSMDSLDTFANNILDLVTYNKREVKWNF